MVGIKPTGDRLVVEIIEDKEVTKSGIEIIRKQRTIYKAKIIANGPGRREAPLSNMEGGMCLFYWFDNCKHIDTNNRSLVVIRADNILVYWEKGSIEENYAPDAYTKSTGIHKIRDKNINIISDWVLVRPDKENDEIEFLGDKLKLDTSYNKAEHAVRRGEVLQVPNRIHQRLKTTLDIKVGDTVYYSFLGEEVAHQKGQIFEFVEEGNEAGERIMFIEYEQMYMAMRRRKWEKKSVEPSGQDYVHKYVSESDPDVEIELKTSSETLFTGDLKRLSSIQSQHQKVIMLNGYLLVEALPSEVPDMIGGIVIPDTAKEQWSQDYGIVLHVGKPTGEHYDEFQEGQKVMLSVHAAIPLESELHQTFKKGKKIYRVDRNSVEGIIID